MQFCSVDQHISLNQPTGKQFWDLNNINFITSMNYIVT